jgi:hypothetical protein
MIAAGSILPIAPAPFELLVTSFARSAAADLHSLRNQKLPPFRSAVGQFSMIASGSVFHDRSQIALPSRPGKQLSPLETIDRSE